jgi:hypothetical protein
VAKKLPPERKLQYNTFLASLTTGTAKKSATVEKKNQFKKMIHWAFGIVEQLETI